MEPTQTQSMFVEAGQLIGERYKLSRLLGAGGFAKVFLAHDQSIERDVAIKFLDLRGVHGNDEMVNTVLERFRRESKLAARIQHRNVVQIYDIGMVQQDIYRPYIVMELLEGRSLHAQVRNVGPLTPSQGCVVAAQAARAVAALHDVGLLHRDVKPANVFLLQGERIHAKRIDLGMSMRVGETDPNVTAPGKVIGTPSYMAPEVLRGQNVGPAVDVFGIGQTLYESLTGSPMIAPRKDIAATFEAVLHEPVSVPSARRPGVPEAVDAVVRRACAKDPARRYASALALMEACEEAARIAAAPEGSA